MLVMSLAGLKINRPMAHAVWGCSGLGHSSAWLPSLGMVEMVWMGHPTVSPLPHLGFHACCCWPCSLWSLLPRGIQALHQEVKGYFHFSWIRLLVCPTVKSQVTFWVEAPRKSCLLILSHSRLRICKGLQDTREAPQPPGSIFIISKWWHLMGVTFCGF